MLTLYTCPKCKKICLLDDSCQMTATESQAELFFGEIMAHWDETYKAYCHVKCFSKERKAQLRADERLRKWELKQEGW